jgi:large subunit ribosomal protein L33
MQVLFFARISVSAGTGKGRQIIFPHGSGKSIQQGGAATMRVKVTLACTECKQRNYDTMKNKKNDPERLEMNKYCRFCKKHTVHRETK